MDNQRRKTLLIGIAFVLPLLFIGIVLVSTTIPSARLHTDYDFVYATCSEGNNNYGYDCGNYLSSLYAVSNGVLTRNSIPDDLDSDRDGILDRNENYRIRFYFHDTESNTSREISLTDAEQYNLSGLITSPDNVSFEWESSRSNGFFLFYSTASGNGYYLTSGRARKQLNLIGDNEYYYFQNNLRFLGWVID